MANPTFRILWWALVASLLPYMVIAHVAPVPVAPEAPVSLLLPVFGSLALAIAVGTLIHRRRALSAPIRAGKLDPSTREGMQAAFKPYIINLALSESVGIYGLVLSLLSGRPVYAAAFCAVSLVLLVLHRPTAPDLRPPLSAHRP